MLTDNKKNIANKKLILMIFYILLIGLISIIISLIGAVNSTNNSGLYYNIELYYDKGNTEIKSIEVEFSNEEKSNFNKDNSYYLNIIDNKNKILDKIFFSVPNFVIYDFVDEQGNFIETNESGFKILENVSFNVFANYDENVYEIIVYNKNDKELDRNLVSQFSKTGFNKEDFINIENDTDNFSEEGVVEERSKAVFDYKNYIIILSLILIFLIIALIYFLSRKK